MQPVRNTAEGVRSTSIMMVCFVHAAGMALRATPSARRDREKLRQNQHLSSHYHKD